MCLIALKNTLNNGLNGKFYVVSFAQRKQVGMTKKIGTLISDCLGSSPWFHHHLAVCTFDQVHILLEASDFSPAYGAVREPARRSPTRIK